MVLGVLNIVSKGVLELCVLFVWGRQRAIRTKRLKATKIPSSLKCKNHVIFVIKNVCSNLQGGVYLEFGVFSLSVSSLGMISKQKCLSVINGVFTLTKLLKNTNVF